jgi:hypothetical protein
MQVYLTSLQPQAALSFQSDSSHLRRANQVK